MRPKQKLGVLWLAAIIMCLQTADSQIIYNTSLYTLGPDLLPHFPAYGNSSNSSLPGGPSDFDNWVCHDTCDYTQPFYICYAASIPANVNESVVAVDLDSVRYFDNVTHSVAITSAGQYVVYVEWITPILDALGKKFRLFIGNTTMFDITCNTTVIQVYGAQNSITLGVGNIEVYMHMYGTTPDSWGMLVSKVYLHQLLPLPEPTNATSATSTTNASTNSNSNTNGNTNNNTNNSSNPANNGAGNITNTTTPSHAFDYLLNGIMLNDFSKLLNRIPGNRIIFFFITEFMDVFDRFYLYYYHRQNNTFYSQIFLRQNAQFTQNKSSLIYILIQMCSNSSKICEGVMNTYNQLSTLLTQKYNYTDPDFLQKNSNGIGFFSNHLDFVYFQIPFTLLNMYIFYQVFQLLFRYKISIFFRKYSLFAIILFITFQGNVQQFAFDIFCELKCFFSINFVHKIANVAILLILYFMLIFSVASLLWMKFHYKKLVKYFVEYYSQTACPLIFQSCERMVFPLILGGVHAFAIQNMRLQTMILMGMQVVYLVLKMLSLRAVKVKEKLTVVFSFVASAMRIMFIATFYLFEVSNQQVINNIHRDLIIVYIGNWALETVIGVTATLVQMFILFKNIFIHRCFNSYTKFIATQIFKADEVNATVICQKQTKNFINAYIVTKDNEKMYLFDSVLKREPKPSKREEKDKQVKTKKKGFTDNYLKIKAPLKEHKNRLVIKECYPIQDEVVRVRL